MDLVSLAAKSNNSHQVNNTETHGRNMNTKRLFLWALVLTLVCCSGTAFAANTVVIPDQSVDKGATGMTTPVAPLATL